MLFKLPLAADTKNSNVAYPESTAIGFSLSFSANGRSRLTSARSPNWLCGIGSSSMLIPTAAKSARIWVAIGPSVDSNSVM